MGKRKSKKNAQETKQEPEQVEDHNDIMTNEEYEEMLHEFHGAFTDRASYEDNSIHYSRNTEASELEDNPESQLDSSVKEKILESLDKQGMREMEEKILIHYHSTRIAKLEYDRAIAKAEKECSCQDFKMCNDEIDHDLPIIEYCNREQDEKDENEKKPDDIGASNTPSNEPNQSDTKITENPKPCLKKVSFSPIDTTLRFVTQEDEDKVPALGDVPDLLQLVNRSIAKLNEQIEENGAALMKRKTEQHDNCDQKTDWNDQNQVTEASSDQNNKEICSGIEPKQTTIDEAAAIENDNGEATEETSV